MEKVIVDNEEATEAWNGVLFDRWMKFREIVTDGLGAHGEEALSALPPKPGDRALDIGCGLGDTTHRLAELAGPEGSAFGVDVAERMIEVAQSEAEEEQKAGAGSVSFATMDVQDTQFDRRFDYAFSRMGTMFFASPVAALRNVRAAMEPGAPLNMVVWRRKLDNEIFHRAELVAEKYLEEPEESDEPTCGPGPFSMANADTTSDVLKGAGFESIELRRCDIPIRLGADLAESIDYNLSIGPAGELLRLVGPEEAERVRPQLEADLREALADLVTPDGVIAPASTWIVTARNPG